MPETITEQCILDFHDYPPIGGDDWRYGFETAQVRALDMQMLSRTVLQEMANAENFEQAADSLAGTEYALPQGSSGFAEVEPMLRDRRTAVRNLFCDLMIDGGIVELFRSRDDFANLRLALRRTLTDKPVGTDYSPEGNVPPEQLEQISGDQEGTEGPRSFDYMREAIEEAALAYYQNKDIRDIDYAIDRVQADYNLRRAGQLKSVFLRGLFRTQIDLTNIRTLLRLKFTESEQRNVFLEGGYIETERFRSGIDAGYETLGSMFFATPYYRIVDTSASYVASNNSFLKVEQQCEEHLVGYLKLTTQITAGPQPVIAYLLMKENEIRRVRLLLTAKKSFLDTKLILDRVS